MNFNPTQEQIKSGVRWLVTAFGAGFAGWLAHGGYVTANQVTDALNSQAFMGLAVAVVSGIFGLWNHTQSNAVAVVAKMASDPASPVVGVVTTNDAAGRAIADAHGAVVSVANTPAAAAIAQDNVPPLAQKVA